MLDWLRSIDAWTWVKFACLMAFAAGTGLLYRYRFDQEMKERDREDEAQ